MFQTTKYEIMFTGLGIAFIKKLKIKTFQKCEYKNGLFISPNVRQGD